jgi:hypothetical protein
LQQVDGFGADAFEQVDAAIDGGTVLKKPIVSSLSKVRAM